VVRGDNLEVLVLLLGFVAFPAKPNTFGGTGLCSLVIVNAGGVPVLFPVGCALVVPGGTLKRVLPGGIMIVRLFGGGKLPNLLGNPLPGNCLTVLLLGVEGVFPRDGGLPVRPRAPVLLLGGSTVPNEGGFVEFPPGVCRGIQVSHSPTWLSLASY
jgi:hypothetical protein